MSKALHLYGADRRDRRCFIHQKLGIINDVNEEDMRDPCWISF
jgi:hypothetical protein